MEDQDDIWEENKIKVLVKNIGPFDLIHSTANLIDEKLKKIINILRNAAL